jgi:hypothetical protein
VKGSGVDKPPPIDIKTLIDTMPDRVSLAGMAPVGK